MSIGRILMLGLSLVLIGYTLGRYAKPDKEVIKTVTQTQTVEVVHHDVKTVTHEVTTPDGTKTIDTVSTDVSKDKTSIDSNTKSETVIDNQKQWLISGQFSPKSNLPGYIYGGSIQKRVLGPAFGGVFVNTETIGITLSLEF